MVSAMLRVGLPLLGAHRTQLGIFTHATCLVFFPISFLTPWSSQVELVLEPGNGDDL